MFLAMFPGRIVVAPPRRSATPAPNVGTGGGSGSHPVRNPIQDRPYRPHLHFIVTGGGLTPGGHWIHAHPKFLVPVQALSEVFRARFRDALRNRHADIYAQIHPAAWRLHNWVVHSKPVGTGHTALALHVLALPQPRPATAARFTRDPTPLPPITPPRRTRPGTNFIAPRLSLTSATLPHAPLPRSAPPPPR